ncbi:hypothetical protein PENTCL1PPCAC_10444 [Pristionchus entomophagus]|uniref:Uncharacterized protein n=1 Tax=Pristionchus entomophagus TaxID=358040 RepID=A0AAV5T6U8_9BILA|nr:hypothetical protein PENTCL1PPCAC_10444 [Pristionchus entomophagus]
MMLFLLFVTLIACHAKVDEATNKKIDEIYPAVESLMGGVPEDFNDTDKQAFDQFIVDVVAGKLLTIDAELVKLKHRSSKAYDVLYPLAIYFKNGYEKLKNPEGRQFFVKELPAVTSEGIGFGTMISVAYNYYQLPDEATKEIGKAFHEMFE